MNTPHEIKILELEGQVERLQEEMEIMKRKLQISITEMYAPLNTIELELGVGNGVAAMDTVIRMRDHLQRLKGYWR